MKIRIICTEHEKYLLEYNKNLLKERICPLFVQCPHIGNCDECIEKAVEWEVTDNE